jgi:hypothetical protein
MQLLIKLDFLMAELANPQSVVRSRTGSVLGRGFVLKSDHFARGVGHIKGAPNFRKTGVGIFGVAQPTVSGIITILTLLQSESTGLTEWINAREVTFYETGTNDIYEHNAICS